MTLSGRIKGDDMVGISINTDKVLGILKVMNQRQKEQDMRIFKLESVINDFIEKSEFKQLEAFTADKVKELEGVQRDLRKDLVDIKTRGEQEMQETINELLVTQSIANKNIFSGFDAKLSDLTNNVSELYSRTEKELPKDIEDLNNRLKYMYSEFQKKGQKDEEKYLQFLQNQTMNKQIKGVDSSSKQVPTLTKTPAANFESLKKEVFEELDRKLKKITEVLTVPESNSSLSFSLSKDQNDSDNIPDSNSTTTTNNNLGLTPSKVVEMLTTMNYNKAMLAKLTSQIDDLQNKMEGQDKGNVNSNRSLNTLVRKPTAMLDPTFDVQEKLSYFHTILKSVTDKVNNLEDEFSNMGEKVDENEKIIRPVIYSLIDGLRLIHAHAAGMEEIPVQNFVLVSQKYFRDDPDFKKKSSVYCARFPPKSATPIRETHFVASAGDDSDEENDENDQKGENLENNRCDENHRNNEDSENNEKNENNGREGKKRNIKPKDSKTLLSDSYHNTNNVRSMNNFNERSLKNDSMNGGYSNKDVGMREVKTISGLLHLVSSHTVKKEFNSDKIIKNNNSLSQKFKQSQLHIHHITMIPHQDSSLSNKNSTDNNLGNGNENENNNDNKDEYNDINSNCNELKQTDNFVIVDMKIGGENTEESPSFADARDLCFMLGQFKREKDELMSTVDRKVDRELVERLFNKFRILLNEMNEKIGQIQNGTERFATVKQIEELVHMIADAKHSCFMQSSKDATAAGRVPCAECLVCGRGVGYVAGGISARSLGSNEESTQFVYGDGGVFRKDAMLKKTKLPPLRESISYA